MQEAVERTHLKRLIRLRFVAIAGQVAAIALASYGLGLRLPLVPMAGVVLALLLFNLFTLIRVRRVALPVRRWELPAQLLVDLAALTALLYFSGGYSNPFVFIFLLPLALGAAIGSGWQAALLLLAAVACYSFLAVSYEPLRGLEASPLLAPVDLHLVGMWVCFVVSAALMAFFVFRTSQSMRENERLLAEARERAVRNEHLAALGSVAAGTAHELGTPLATLTLAVGELEADYADRDPELAERLRVLREQVYRCKHVVQRLSGDAGALRADSGGAQRLDDWLRQLVARWRDGHPQVSLRFDVAEPGGKPPCLVIDQALSQAVHSLLDNAARVSRSLTCYAHWDMEELTVEVLDRGPGVPPDLAGRLGREPVSGLPGVAGLGLGLYLAGSTLERLGGHLWLQTREGGGTRARLRLPLAPLRVERCATVESRPPGLADRPSLPSVEDPAG